MEKLLNDLLGRVLKAFPDQLLSVVLYGSAASDEGPDQLSDINILCVLTEVRPADLAAAEPVFRWWREKGNPAPLLLGHEEMLHSTDCFPIEFTDIRERHRILYGQDVVADLKVDYVFYRAQVEHELRAKLLRLRQKAGGMLSDEGLLTRLMADSVSTFCVLFRHAMLLAGEIELRFGKADVVAAAAGRFGVEKLPLMLLLDVREGHRLPKETKAADLFGQYLEQIQKVIDAVNKLER